MATRKLAELTDLEPVTCVERTRIVFAVCMVGDLDLAEALVRAGLALAVHDQSLDYVPAEEAAMEARAGMWPGKFIPSWVWRDQQRRGRQPAPAPGTLDPRLRRRLNAIMFGLPSLSKLLVLVGVILFVWYGFKLVSRLEQARKTKGGQELKREAGSIDTVQCAVCKIFLAADATSNCGRPDCPYLG